MFFDETYSEHYYRKETVVNFAEQSDCLIVIGTALATNLAKQIVCTFLNKELPVIEINMESAINRGNNIQVLGKSEQTLPALFEEYYRLNSTLPNVKAMGAGKAPVKKGKKGSAAAASAKRVSPKSTNTASKGKKGPNSAAASAKQ